MAQLTVFAIASIIVILLLIQPISLRFMLSNGYRFILDYSFISLIAEPSSDNRRKRKKRRIPSIKAITKFARAILRSSKITIQELRLPSRNSEDDTLSFDVILETRLYNILFAGIILLYEELKRRIRRLNV